MIHSTNLPQAVKTAIQSKGIPEETALSQLERFEKGFPDLVINRPATPEDGITRIPADQENQYTERFNQARKEGRVMKFVPASGAASRMFKPLQAMLNDSKRLNQEYLESYAVDADADADADDNAAFTLTFLQNLEHFAFYDDLSDALKQRGLSVEELRKKQDYHTLLDFILNDSGLGLAALPKALIPFHRYDSHNRAPLEEHLAEAIAYTCSEDGSARLHFTISPEHKEAFDRRLAAVRPRFESGGIQLNVETSFQKPETDTMAVDPDNRPFLDDDGNAVFRPGGHGALLVNLEELKGDIVFIKNIDNVVPDRIRESTIRYKKLIGGYLLMLQDKIFFYLKELDREGERSMLLDEMLAFLRDALHVEPPGAGSAREDLPLVVSAGKDLSPGEPPQAESTPENLPPSESPPNESSVKGLSRKELVQWLHDRLNRPIRVCGMVRNEGEPGGGPFFVENDPASEHDSAGVSAGVGVGSDAGAGADTGVSTGVGAGMGTGTDAGTRTGTSLQIVESAQVNMDDPDQKKIFDSSTHFNPVDIACGLRDYRGRPFRLDSYRDPETGFISEKSYQGRDLKALELPGLWNGAMARWNTVFAEVPSETFNPVKTVNDLLREEHTN